MWKRGSTFSSSEFPHSAFSRGFFFVVNPWDRTFFGPDGRNTLTHRDMLKIFGNVVQEVKDEMKEQGREDEFIGSKVILAVVIFASFAC